MKQCLQVDKVVFSYKNKTGNNINVIRMADIVFHEGKVHAIYGQPEAGKSTLMRLIAGFDHPDSGEIRFDGKDIATMDPYTYRSSNVGICFFDFDVIDRYTAVENVVLAMEAAKSDRKKDKKKQAQMLLDKTGLGKKSRNVKAGKLDDDERQRVRLARAMANDAKVLLIDDVNAYVRNEKAKEFLDLIGQMAHEDGYCIIYTTDEEAYTKAADVVMRFNRGTVVIK